MITTQRLLIEPLEVTDDGFIFNLLNQPSFIDNIGDKGIRDLAAARQYIVEGPQASYRRLGIGLWKVSLREPQQAIGLAGLLQRDYLPHPDLGYALLPEYTGKGLAYEANCAVLRWAKEHGYANILAICNPHNKASHGLLLKLGFVEDGEVVPPTETQPIKRYQCVLS